MNAYVEMVEEIMRESLIRKEAINKLIDRISQILKEKSKNLKCLEEMKRVLKNYEVENGVAVFLAAGEPSDKKLIAKIENGNEYVLLWWGKNKNFLVGENCVNPYGLGITFKGKEKNEISEYSREELKREFRDFARIFSQMEKGKVFTLKVYAKPDKLVAQAKNIRGIWLLREPVAGSMESIGRKVSNNNLYIYQKGGAVTTSYTKVVKIAG